MQAAAAFRAQIPGPCVAVADAAHDEVTGGIVALERELRRFGAEQGTVLVDETVDLRVGVIYMVGRADVQGGVMMVSKVRTLAGAYMTIL